jgi:N4-gp56 family major capsid protein
MNDNEMMTTLKRAQLSSTTSPNLAGLIPQIWEKQIIKDAQEKRMFEQFAFRNTTLMNTPGKSVIMPVETNVTSMTQYGEGEEVTPEDLDTLDDKEFETEVDRRSFFLTYQAVKKTNLDLVAQRRSQMTNYAASVVDQTIAQAIALDGDNAADILYGGDATTAATLEAGDILTPSKLSQAVTVLKTNKWINQINTPKQFVFFMGPEQGEAFREESQFIDVSKYGSNEVVMNGEIGRFIGVKIIETPNIPFKSATQADWSDGTNWAVDGNTCILTVGQIGYGIAWAEEPNIEYKKEPLEGKHFFVLSQDYKADTLQPKAIVLIKVANV